MGLSQNERQGEKRGNEIFLDLDTQTIIVNGSTDGKRNINQPYTYTYTLNSNLTVIYLIGVSSPPKDVPWCMRECSGHHRESVLSRERQEKPAL